LNKRDLLRITAKKKIFLKFSHGTGRVENGFSTFFEAAWFCKQVDEM